MVALQGLLVSASLALSAFGLAIERNGQACASYSKLSATTQKGVELEIERLTRGCFKAIISARGTTEPQGPSIGFKNMNSNILKQKNGGNVVCTGVFQENLPFSNYASTMLSTQPPLTKTRTLAQPM